MNALRRFNLEVMWHSTSLFCVVCVLAIATGCAGMPGAADKSVTARVADALQVADGIVTTTRTLLAADAISPENALSVAKSAVIAKDAANAVLALAAKECPDQAPACP